MVIQDELLRISEISIDGLFGLYDHNVKLNLLDRVTIIHGPNGIGKTQILRFVEAFTEGKYFQFNKIPFDKFEIIFNNGKKVGIRKNSNDIKDGFDFEFFLIDENGIDRNQKASIDKKDFEKVLMYIRREMPLSRTAEDMWIDRHTGTKYSSEELFANYYDQVPDSIKKKFATPEWLGPIVKKIETHLIETQRLFNVSSYYDRSNRIAYEREENLFSSTVQEYAKDLKKRINDTLTEYAKVSQSLDQTFPQRLLGGAIDQTNIDDLKNRMEALEQKRSNLKQIGLLGQDVTNPFDITTLDGLNDSQKTPMALYVEDTEKKLNVLDPISERMTVMLEKINKKFRNKELKIDKLDGFTIIDSSGDKLTLDVLSSGEQHELVLIYSLLFKVRPNALVMIDEPELSLHVTWQRAFLNDIMDIAKTASFDVLLATHSPYIVGDRHDLMISLGEED
ncbi:AAA family ATPase [Sulfuricurvum sp.]|uniref:AAA family ATPase n=1 Tax=Sulfuricurvum sp. TaxID=2025608 RepID=UPI002638A6DE|nr:AAA family ATPase [Sulfuricurvum sp.]MDD4950894.1 AAA family ATPase [Sulfuricurvum sp.]